MLCNRAINTKNRNKNVLNSSFILFFFSHFLQGLYEPGTKLGARDSEMSEI